MVRKKLSLVERINKDIELRVKESQQPHEHGGYTDEGWELPPVRICNHPLTDEGWCIYGCGGKRQN